MVFRFPVAGLVFASIALASAGAWAQNAATQQPQPAPGFPDACRLMPQSDLEALFPGRPITPKGPTLSPIYKGPQYAEGCMYSVQLPSPDSKLDVYKIVSLSVMRCGACSKDNDGAAETFARVRAAKEKLNPQVASVPGIGDDAFQVVSEYDVAIYVRKDDLIFFLSLSTYSPQTLPNAVALAGQISKRWRGGVGMVEAANAIASNSSVDVPPDTRVSDKAPPDKWPDACALLAPEDVGTIFADMSVDKPRKLMGQIKYYSRVDRVENLPNPIRCEYSARKTDIVNGQRQSIFNSIEMSVQNVAATADQSKKFYEVALKVGGADTAVAGLGDEASIDPMNRIYIRKGIVTVAIRVGGGERDQVLYADARKRVNALARLVAAKLP